MRDRYEFAIAIFKLVKAGLLLLAGIGALSLLNDDVRASVQFRIWQLAADPHFHRLQRFASWLGIAGDRKAEILSAGSLLYAAVFAVEGFGLLRGKQWARYVTAIVTASFLPIEIYEMLRHLSYFKLGLIALNVLIVIYLVWRLRDHQGD